MINVGNSLYSGWIYLDRFLMVVIHTLKNPFRILQYHTVVSEVLWHNGPNVGGLYGPL